MINVVPMQYLLFYLEYNFVFEYDVDIAIRMHRT